MIRLFAFLARLSSYRPEIVVLHEGQPTKPICSRWFGTDANANANNMLIMGFPA